MFDVGFNPQAGSYLLNVAAALGDQVPVGSP